MSSLKTVFAVFAIFLLSSSLFGAPSVLTPEENSDAIFIENLRSGLSYFYDGQYEMAVKEVEKALTAQPSSIFAKALLGKIYFTLGDDSSALSFFDSIAASGKMNTSTYELYQQIKAEADIPKKNSAVTWVSLLNFKLPKEIDKRLFSPSSITAVHDGTNRYVVTDWKGGELLYLDANGALLKRQRLASPGKPTPGLLSSIILPETGQVLVSLFNDDKLALLPLNRGGVDPFPSATRIFGSSGGGRGELLGPSYLVKAQNKIFVTDWGNQRVGVFSLTGLPLFSFSNTFSDNRLSTPSGIAAADGNLYIIDKKSSSLNQFDLSGNPIATYFSPLLKDGETLKYWKNGLYAASGSSVVRYDLHSHDFSTELTIDSPRRIALQGLDFDSNGNLVLTSPSRQSVLFYSPLRSISSSLVIHRPRLFLSGFPHVKVSFTLRDAVGNPVLGLTRRNFRISENSRNVPFNLIPHSHVKWTSHVVLITDRASLASEASAEKIVSDRIALAIRQKKRENQSFHYVPTYIFSGAAVPQTEDSLAALQKTAQRIPASSGGSAAASQSIFMGLNALSIKNHAQEMIVYFQRSRLSSQSFSAYPLTNLQRMLSNKSIPFYYIYFDKETASQELTYLANKTGGMAVLYKDTTFSMIKKWINHYVPFYTITYDSTSHQIKNLTPLTLSIEYGKKRGEYNFDFFAPLLMQGGKS